MNKDNKNLKTPNNSSKSNQVIRSSSGNIKGGNGSNQNVKQPSSNRQAQDSNNSSKNNNKKTKLSKQEKSERKKQKKEKRKQGCLIFFIVTLFAFTAIMFLGAGVLFRILDETPELNLISVEPNVYTSIVYDKDGIEIDRFHGDENREYMTLDNISPYFANAMVAVEDQRFYEHGGIDLRGIARAAVTTVQNKITGATGVQGASTITQQLIKNNVTKVTRNTFTTKVQEQYLALMYEKRLENQFGSKKVAKDYILELYLNTIGLGHGYNGVEAAALGYFNKEAIDLTLAESACIAAITNNPSLYSPRTQPENNKSRVDKILNHMLEQGMISRYEYQEALAEDLYSKISDGYSENKVEGNIIHGYFEDAVFEEVSKDLQEQHNLSRAQANNLIYNGGLQIYTTKDTAMQKQVDESYRDTTLFPDVVYAYDVTYTVSTLDSSTGSQEHKEYKQFVRSLEAGEEFTTNKRAEIEASLSSTQSIVADATSYSIQPQSSMVIIDYNTGYVTSIAGGRGEKVVNRGFNRATDSMRQPGSVFKVLAAYAPAIDLSIVMPGSIIVDEPFEVGNYSPSNWYGENYRGPSTAREGIEQSMNILAVKVMDMVGVDPAYKYLLNFGFTTLQDDNHLSTALGGITYGVTQLEVTAAYGAIANGGYYYKPTFYTKVFDHDGHLLLDNTEREPVQILKESTAFMLTDMMAGVVTQGTGTAARLTTTNMPVAGKTGTTQETKDLTFVGYTPYYVAGIWLGYDRYDTIVPNMMATVDGKRVIANDTFHLKIWKDVMEKIHADLPVVTFPSKPSDVVSTTVCAYSGDLVSSSCSEKITDYFLRGTEPTKYCDSHTMLNICSVTDLLANQYCGKFTTQRASSSTSPITFCAVHSATNSGNAVTTTISQDNNNNNNDNNNNNNNTNNNNNNTQADDNIFDFNFEEIINPNYNSNNTTNNDNNLNFNIGDIIGTTTTEQATQQTTQYIPTTQATTVPIPPDITIEITTQAPIITEAQTQAPIVTEIPTVTTTQAPIINEAPMTTTTQSSEPVFTLP